MCTMESKRKAKVIRADDKMQITVVTVKGEFLPPQLIYQGIIR